MDRNDAQGNAASRQVLIIGGGLAGLSAACELADRGYRVDLFEKRPYLGGRTFSFRDKATGEEIDNGQHIFMKCCTSYIEFLKRLGVYDRTYVQERLSVTVYGKDGRSSALKSARLPPPLHLGPSLAGYKHLSLREKLAVLRGGLALRGVSAKKLWGLDGVSFYDWLKAHGQPDRAIDSFWNLIILPTLNDDARDVSAAQAIMVFQEGFMKNREAADIGIAKVGLSALLADEAREYIESRGGCVHLGEGIASLDGTLEAIEGARTSRGAMHRADAYVTAVPPNRLLALLPPALRTHESFARAGRLGMSPIVNMHVWLDRTVTDLPFATYLESHVQWVFNRSAMQRLGFNGSRSQSDQRQHLVISVSGAHKLIDMPKEDLAQLLLEDLRRRIPAAREARVLSTTIVRERFATFTASPGSAANRPPCKTPVPNLFLAGEWTATGWPSTMESAVRSGMACAREVMAAP